MMFTQFEMRLIGCLGAVVAIFALVMYLEHRGAAKCVAADKAEVAVQTVHKATVEATEAAVVVEEKQTYDQAVDRPLVRPINVSLCGAAPAVVRPAPTAGPRADAAPAGPAGHRDPAVPGPDIGPGLQRTGQQADAQIIGLQDYIKRVCLSR
ncbi:MAG: hypothetical protein JWO52_7823 [Gammaproteobacteria bacterium]|nr:hypothetical protein [Gammaproteobacteria bacterium]